MKRIADKTLTQVLSAQSVGTPMRGSDDFWADFKARARMHPQQQPATATWRPTAWPVYARVCAAAAVVAIAGWFMLPAAAEPESVIRSVEVLAPHDAVLILKDAHTESTVLWITGMHPDAGNGGGL